jgi:hypothetical protein
MKRYLVLITIAILTSCSPLKKYSSFPVVTNWESEIQKFEALDQQENYPDNSIIFAGSSSIRLWETMQKDMSPCPVIQI